MSGLSYPTPPDPFQPSDLSHLCDKVDPKTSADYERLAAASPSSSFVWIKWMAFLIQMGDVDQARVVAEKALEAIGY